MKISRLLLLAQAIVAVTALSGCTVRYDFSQCESDSDCGASEVCEPETGLCTLGQEAVVTSFSDGVSSTTVRTVGIADLSGSLKDLGGGMRDGVLAAYAAHNTLSTRKYMFEHTALDDVYDPEKSVELVDSVIRPQSDGTERQAFAIVGSMGVADVERHAPDRERATGSVLRHLQRRESPSEVSPERTVWNTRASYQLEGEVITLNQLTRDPKPINPRNIFAFAQSPIDSNVEGYADISQRVAEDDPTALDPYGLSGYRGVVDALSQPLSSQTEIPLASYRATSTNTKIAREYFFKWLLGLDDRLDGPVLSGADDPDVGIVMVAVASAATDFVVGVIDGLDQLKAGEKPSVISAEDWEKVDPERLAMVQKIKLTISSISPVGDQLASNLRAAGASDYCTNDVPILVSQVVPFPMGQSGGAIQFREEMEAYDPNFIPGYVNFEGWIAGKAFVAAVEAIEGPVTSDSFFELLESGDFSVDLKTGSSLDFDSNDHEGSATVYGSRLGEGCVYEEFEFD